MLLAMASVYFVLFMALNSKLGHGTCLDYGIIANLRQAETPNTRTGF